MHFGRDVAVASMLGFWASWAAAQSYLAVALPQGTATGMSSCGWVTGNAPNTTAFIYHDGAFTLLPTDAFVARSINNYGDAVGYGVGGKVTRTTTLAITLFGADGAVGLAGNSFVNALGTGINDAINASGTLQLPIGSPPIKQLPILYLNEPHTVTTLEQGQSEVTSGINNSDQVVGNLLGRNTSQAFVYANGVFTNLTVTGAKSTTGNAINEAGDVVGNAVTTARSSQGFAYANGVSKLIGLASGAYNQASGLLALNNTGQSVGYISNASGATHAMLYAGSTLLDLNDVSDAPVPLTIAVGVSDSGEIAALAADGTSYLLVPGGVYPPNTCKTR